MVRLGGQFLLVAARAIAAGERIMTLLGAILEAPTRHTIQIGERQHADMPAGTPLRTQLDDYSWRFLNHSCDPNAVFRGRELFALRDIPPMQEIAFDYNTTEWSLHEPFDCRCGSRDCIGLVRGYRALSPAERRRRRKHTAPHLLALAARETGQPG